MKSFLFLLLLSVSASATTRYVSASGRGTECSVGTPCALSFAVGGGSSPVAAGDTVELATGIYQYDSVTFGPAGTSPSVMTVYKAAPGARPIVTSTTNTIPHVAMHDYMQLDGIWMGGSKSTSKGEPILQTGGTPISHWKWITNCTFFGGNDGLISGSSEYLVVQGSRFIHCGYQGLYHALYISSVDKLPPPKHSFTQHVIVDHNIFIAGGTGGGDDGGYGLHFFHNNRTCIASRNFVTYQYGLVYDGQYGLFVNNYCWKCGNGTGLAINFGYPTNSMLLNNILGGPEDYVINTVDPTNTVRKNAYVTSSNGGFSKGDKPIRLTAASEAAQQGISATALDTAIAAINASFAASPTTILADSTIETNFAVIAGITIPSSGSRLYHAGVHWYDGNPINVGPNSGAPTNTITSANDVGCWWAAFRAMGLLEYDKNANVITSGFLPCATGGTGGVFGGKVKPVGEAQSSRRTMNGA